MSRKEKLLNRMLDIPNDFTFDELTSVLVGLGFSITDKGKTSGSRVAFIMGQSIIRIHKQHPKNIIKRATLKDVITHLKHNNLL